MAFSSAPEKQTHTSKRLPAFYDLNYRNGIAVVDGGYPFYKDSGTVNLLPAKAKGTEDLYAISRPPLIASQNLPAGECRGIYVWEKTSVVTYYYAVVGDKVYTTTVLDGGGAVAFAAVQTLTTSTGHVSFAEHINDTAVKKLILVDGAKGYVFTSNLAPTEITDADFPTPHVPYVVFIDGYIFVAKKDTGDIYNSNLNAPETWTAGSFISSELYPDDITALAKVNNYLVAIGQHGCEYFYDAANSIGSPLARQDGSSLPFGTAYPRSVASNKNTLMFLANNNDGEPVVKMIEDFKHREVPCDAITKFITYRNLTEGVNPVASVRGQFARINGDLVYVLTWKGGNYTPGFCFHLASGKWSELRYGTGREYANSWPVWATHWSGKARAVTYALCDFGGAGSSSSNKFCQWTHSPQNPSSYDNTSVPIYHEIRTDGEDYGTMNLKTMNRFGVDVETNATDSSSITMYLQYSDNDFVDWSASRPIEVKGGHYPFVTQLGAFRKRSFVLWYSGDKAIRVRFLEIDINRGQQ